MRRLLKNKIVSGLTAAMLILTAAVPSMTVLGDGTSGPSSYAYTKDVVTSTETDSVLSVAQCNENLKWNSLQVEVEDSDITLEGLMPVGAEAEAKDVTLEQEADVASVMDAATELDATEGTMVAAFDISIKEGNDEYQPNEEHPIKVTISDERFEENDELIILHLKDDEGEEVEVVEDYDVIDGELSFEATGFSVYEIINRNSTVKPPATANDYDGKSYGLMSYTSGTHGFALMAGDDNVHALIQLITRKTSNKNGRTLYVDEKSEVTKWQFHWVERNKYKLSAVTAEGTVYLAVSGDDLTLVESEAAATVFELTEGNNNDRVSLSTGGKYVTFNIEGDGTNTTYSFGLSSTASSLSWLSLVDFVTLTNSDLISYSADRVSISEVENGDTIIIYTRIWNKTTKKYDIYAVDYNGTLYPCYASGGKILWVGDGSGSLEWKFTEYYDKVTKEPNNYYELYNPYSQKFIAPQIIPNQVLSSGKLGIHIPRRRKGAYYSEITAWDSHKYAYVGLKAELIPGETDKYHLVPCSESTAIPFYFAKPEELNQSDSLHKVDTVDNTLHGITIKMKNFAGDINGTGSGATEQQQYILYDAFDAGNPTDGLLSTSLEENGYPVTTKKATEKSGKKVPIQNIGGLFAGAETVNHLFLENEYNSSGYFQFDSTENFATLKATNDGNFTVYRELGTSYNTANKPTLKHGQFYPYNIISEGNYSRDNPENLFSTDARPNSNTRGALADSEPRKYEKLYSAGSTGKVDGQDYIDFYFGMELEAEFVQTVSGFDSWGHDIIFEFKGDDDFWLYVDDELVLDLGGIHSALGGTVNFRTGEVHMDKDNTPNKEGINTTLRDIFKANYLSRGMSETEADDELDEIFEKNEQGQYTFKDYSRHKMKAFYMERGGGASNLKMKFNLASVTPGSVVLNKKIDGEGQDLLDKDFLEYPFQIYYTPIKEDGTHGEEKLLDNNSQVGVRYQSDGEPVKFNSFYRPPGFTDEEAYKNVYFINPTKNTEILFPEKIYQYRIVECAVDSSVYDKVLINNEEPDEDHKSETKGLVSYSSVLAEAGTAPSVTFDNHTRGDIVKSLKFRKVLVDDKGEEIEDEDGAKFDFRLRLSPVEVSEDEIPLSNMYNYYVLSPKPAEKICRFDESQGGFVDTGMEYNQENIQRVKNGGVAGLAIEDIEFKTSPFGAISNIPVGYTVCVPGLPIGSVFKVTEEVKPGYGVFDYKRELGTRINEDGDVEQIPSYYVYDEEHEEVGKIISTENAIMTVKNQKGFGYTVKKKWSDLDITDSHDPIYVGIYVDGEYLPGSLKKIESPAVSTYYFWTSLKKKPNGTARWDFTGYEAKEIKINSGTPTCSEDGSVTNEDELSFSPLKAGDTISLKAERTESATPEGQPREKEFDYLVSYEQGTFDGNTQTDTIKNTRKGGIAIRLFKWDSTAPLAGGTFSLKDSSGKTVGSYTSDSEGKVAIIYEFERNELYTLSQDSAPEGYVGLRKTLTFKVDDQGNVSLYKKDGSTEWGSTDTEETKWVSSSPGVNGIDAFIDVHNKPFNFKLVKEQNGKPSNKLGGAHFALYKQVFTTINGNVKGKDPMPGFEDMVTMSGEVDICGGNSGRTIDPGDNGSVFYLTETQAPLNYTKLTEDIVFRISPLGVPSVISEAYEGNLVETEDSYVYTLSVPNTKQNSNMMSLVVTKKIAGNMGDRTKEFDFTLSTNNTSGTYDWTLNGVIQTEKMSASNGQFRLGDGDEAVIMVPKGTVVTVSENADGYKPSVIYNGADPEEVNQKEITVNDDSRLEFTNTYETLIPTGVWISIGGLIAAFIITSAGVIWFKRRGIVQDKVE